MSKPTRTPQQNYALTMGRAWVPGVYIGALGNLVEPSIVPNAKLVAYAVRVADSVCTSLDTKRNNGART